MNINLDKIESEINRLEHGGVFEDIVKRLGITHEELMKNPSEEARKAHLEVTREFQENIIKLEGYKGIRDATKKALQEQERAITRLKLLQTVTLEVEKNGCIDTLYDDIGQICDI